MTALRVNGFDIHKAYLTPDAQSLLHLVELRRLLGNQALLRA